MTRLKLSADERLRYLNDPLVKRWVTRLAKGSDKTATMWSSGLTIFFHLTETTPKRLASMKKQELMDLADRYEAIERARGTRSTTIASRLGFVRNFVQFSSDIMLPTGTFKVKGGNDSKEEAALSREQLHAVLASANLREKVCVALMSQSGLRPGVMGNFDGTDGLRVDDVIDMHVDRKVEFVASPAILRVRKELSKAGHSYLTMVGEQAQDVVRLYVESRLRNGETITADSPLVRTDGGRFARSSEVGDYVRNAFKRAKVTARPYSCRTTFISRLSACEADGLVTHEYRLFWSGHRGDVSATYSVNRGHLDERTLSRMRDSFRKCEALLATVTPQDPRKALLIEANSTMLQIAGYDEVEAQRLAQDPGSDIAALAKARLGGATVDVVIAPPKRIGEQRVVDADAAGRYLEAGWTFKSPLNGTKAVVEWLGPTPSGMPPA